MFFRVRVFVMAAKATLGTAQSHVRSTHRSANDMHHPRGTYLITADLSHLSLVGGKRESSYIVE